MRRLSAPRIALSAAALLLLGAGSGGSSKDLPTIKEARSIAAEWALVNHLAESGRLRSTYATTMREEAISKLETALRHIKDQGGVGAREIAALARLRPDAPSGIIHAHARRLEAIEDGLEAR